MAWQFADNLHRRYLQEFTCAESLWRRLRKLRNPFVRDHWAARVQGNIRNLQPRLKAPRYLLIDFDEDGRRVNAALNYEFPQRRPADPSVTVLLFGVDRRLQGSGLAGEALDRLAAEVAAEGFRRGITGTVRMTALVHPDNAACKSVIKRHGWAFLGEKGEDGFHEVWANRIELG